MYSFNPSTTTGWTYVQRQSWQSITQTWLCAESNPELVSCVLYANVYKFVFNLFFYDFSYWTTLREMWATSDCTGVYLEIKEDVRVISSSCRLCRWREVCDLRLVRSPMHAGAHLWRVQLWIIPGEVYNLWRSRCVWCLLLQGVHHHGKRCKKKYVLCYSCVNDPMAYFLARWMSKDC